MRAGVFHGSSEVLFQEQEVGGPFEPGAFAEFGVQEPDAEVGANDAGMVVDEGFSLVGVEFERQAVASGINFRSQDARKQRQHPNSEVLKSRANRIRMFCVEPSSRMACQNPLMSVLSSTGICWPSKSQRKGMRFDSFFTVRRMQPSSISVAGGGLALPLATPRRSSSNSSQRLTGILRYGIIPSGITLHV